MPDSKSSDFLQRLRAACRESHEALHVHPLLAPLTSASITMNDFQWIISGFHRAYKVMENARGDLKTDLPDAPVMLWLGKDMAGQGLAPLATPPAAAFKAPQDHDELFGYLYVKQGSGLGGQVISKHLEKNLGLVPGRDNHFFAGYGAENGALWKQFTASAAQLCDPQAQQKAIDTAVRSFQFLEASLTETLGLKLAC